MCRSPGEAVSGSGFKGWDREVSKTESPAPETYLQCGDTDKAHVKKWKNKAVLKTSKSCEQDKMGYDRVSREALLQGDVCVSIVVGRHPDGTGAWQHMRPQMGVSRAC